MGAHSPGRVRETARSEGAGATSTPARDFLSGDALDVGRSASARPPGRWSADAATDAVALALQPWRLRRAAAACRAGGCWRWRSSAPTSQRARRRPARSCCASRHEVRFASTEAGKRGQFENLNALLAEHPPEGHDWLLVLDDDVALPRGFLDTFLFLAERFELRLAQPAHRHRSHAAWEVTRRRPAAVVRETRIRRDRAGGRVSPHDVRRAAAVPAAARRVGPRRPLVGGGARARMAHRRRRRDPDPPRPAADRRVLRSRRGDGRGRAVSATTVHTPRPSRRSGRLVSTDPGREGADRRRVLPARRRPGRWRLGPPPDARHRDAGAEVRVLVLHRPLPPLSAVRIAPTSAVRWRWSGSRERRSSTGCSVDYVRYLSPPRPWSYSSWGAWAAPAAAPRAARACAGSSRSTWSTPTTRCPPATRSAARPGRRRWSCRSTATTCRALGPAAGGRDDAAARAARARQQRRDRSALRRAGRARQPRRAPRRRPPADARGAIGSPDARDRRSPGRAQAPRRRDLARWRCCATAIPELRYVIVGDGPERERLARARGIAGRRRPGGVSRPAAQRRGDRRRAAAPRCS